MLMTGIISSLDVVKATSIPRTVNWLWINLWKVLVALSHERANHGAEFGAHRAHDDGKWDSDFEQHLELYGIKPILAKVRHPQTNGKLERRFGEYQKHRQAFPSSEAFIEWYIKRPHGSLDFERLETSERAFRRKMRLEMYFAIGHRLFGL